MKNLRRNTSPAKKSVYSKNNEVEVFTFVWGKRWCRVWTTKDIVFETCSMLSFKVTKFVDIFRLLGQHQRSRGLVELGSWATICYSSCSFYACLENMAWAIRIPRGRAPFVQHQESRPLARSNTWRPRFTDFPSLCSCSESSLTNLIGSRWTWPEDAILGADQNWEARSLWTRMSLGRRTAAIFSGSR